jgi:hypothetical protein
MTAPARVSQGDMQRAAKAARNAGWGTVRIIVDLNQQRMEILLGDAHSPAAIENVWDKEL